MNIKGKPALAPHADWRLGWELDRIGFGSHGPDVKVSGLAVIYGDPANITLGNHVRIDSFVSIVAAGPVKIGDYVHIGSHCSLHSSEAGPIVFGDYSALSSGVHVWGVSDNFDGDWFTNPTCPAWGRKSVEAEVLVGRLAIIGSGAVLLPGACFEEGAALAAGAVALGGTYEEWTIYGGVPAKFLRARKRGVWAKARDHDISRNVATLAEAHAV